MDRRSFLIGSSAILTSAFVDKADWFLRNKNAVVPFEAAKKAANKLYFVELGENCFDLRWATPEIIWPELSYRQWLSKYEDPENRDFLDGRQISDANLQRAMGWHGIEADQLDDIAPFELYEREWELNDSSFAKAYKYLRDLDLTNNNSVTGPKLGNLDFMHEHEVENGCTVGVKSEDPLTASLLQARLIELGHDVSVEIVSA
ncbi:hypothetical protein OAI26_09340 [Sulfitobacter sp.]|jgi:hypothetical protein|nr:hypothetical protein [Sulfitobacter sp.]